MPTLTFPLSRIEGHAQVVIDTNCSLAEVAQRVDELWDDLIGRLAAKAT